MNNAEFNQHEEQADALAASEKEPCEGRQRMQQEATLLYAECFSFEAIKERMQIVNKAYAASHGLLDK